MLLLFRSTNERLCCSDTYRVVEAFESRGTAERVLQCAVPVGSMPYGDMPLIAGILCFSFVP